MTKFILSGGFTKEDNESNQAFHKELLRDVPENGNVLLVYFATENEEDVPKMFKQHVGICQKQTQDKNINFVLATKENFTKQAREADAIFLNGGDTEKLISILKNYPDLKSLLKNKTVSGSSAGAYAIATLGSSHHEDTAREGLALAPLRVICHFESDRLPPNPESVAALKETAPHLELVTLKDHEWKVFSL